MLDGVVVPLQQVGYSVIYALAEALWMICQSLLLVGYYILTLTSWLSQSMFQPLLESMGDTTDSLLLPVFTVAMLVLAISYLLGVFGVFRVVEFRPAVTWLLVAIMWYQFGPEMYQGFERFRRQLSGAFFAQTFTDLTGEGGSIEGLGAVGYAGDFTIQTPQNNFAPFLSFDTTIDGLDVALAYLNADGCDVLRTTGCLVMLLPSGEDGYLPVRWYTADGFFAGERHRIRYPEMTDEERQLSLLYGLKGLWHVFSGMLVALFGVLEQLVQLLLTIAFGFGFLSFFIAILFAFFKRTESVTWAVFDVILGLFIQSIITALLLAVVMAFVSIAGATMNAALLFGACFIGIVLYIILLISAVNGIKSALTGLVTSFAPVTGGNLDASGAMATAGMAAGLVTGGVGAVATGATTWMSGGTAAQSVGTALGPGLGQKAFYAAQAFGSDSQAGQVVREVAQGSSAAYLGPIGGYMLGQSNRSPAELTLGTPITANSADYDADDHSLADTVRAGGSPRPASQPSPEQTYLDPPPSQPAATTVARPYQPTPRAETTIKLPPVYTDTEQAAVVHAGQPNPVLPGDESTILLPPVPTYLAPPPVQAAAAAPAADTDRPAPAPAEAGDSVEQTSPQPAAPSTQQFTPTRPEYTTFSERDEAAADLPAGMSPKHARAVRKLQYSDPTRWAALQAENDREQPPAVPRRSTAGQPAEPAPVQKEQAPAPDETERQQEGVIAIRSVGPATENHLQTFGITTAGELAAANPADLATHEKITPARAQQLVGAAQAHIGTPADPQQASSATPVPPTAAQIAAANDSRDNDDQHRLVVGIGTAMNRALAGGQVPHEQQARDIASTAGLPPVQPAGEFVQLAAAMNLAPNQAQAVLADVQHNGQIGPEVAQAVRTGLSGIQRTSGQPFDDASMSLAIGNLERAAQALITASTGLSDGATAGHNTITTGAEGDVL